MFTFDFYYDLKFWMFFVVIVLLLSCFKKWTLFRNCMLLFSSIYMLLSLPRFGINDLALSLIFTIFVFLGGYLLNKENILVERTNRILFSTAYILIIIFVLSYYKYPFVQLLFRNKNSDAAMAHADIIFLIGISYTSFRMMHFIIECYKRQIKNINFLTFLNYIFYFPAFISGPINRYDDFSKQLISEKEKIKKEDIKIGLRRILDGLFKKLVLATAVFPYTFANYQKDITEMTFFEILLGLYAYTLFFYFDFSGYSDVAIGSARIIGINLPENFSYPFFKRNIQQLWANWHMSLTRWLTDYIYWPMSKRLRRYSFFRNRPITLSNMSIIVTFIVCGIWHGNNLNFLLWGAYHGVGLATLNVYQKWKRKRRNKLIRKYYASKLSKYFGIFITFHFFTFGILLFTTSVEKLSMFF